MFQKTRVVKIVPYNPKWVQEFRQIKSYLLGFIQEKVLEIEHVGSTSVPGLAAKPIIDMDAVIESRDVLPEIIGQLKQAGYKYEGDLGINGREVFQEVRGSNFIRHHLYVCTENSKAYKEHISFRDYLRADEQVMNEYAQLKRDLARRYRYDVDSYCEAKTEFIQSILKKARPNNIK